MILPSNIIIVIKSKRMRKAGRVALRDIKRNTYSVLIRKPEGKTPLGNPDVNSRIILK